MSTRDEIATRLLPTLVQLHGNTQHRDDLASEAVRMADALIGALAAIPVAAELRAAEPATRKPHESITPWPEQVSHEVPASEPVVAIGTNATGTNTPKSRDAGSIRATYTGVVSSDSGPVSRDTNGAAPPPPLVERARDRASYVATSDPQVLDHTITRDLLRELANALEAAQAEAISYRVNFAPYIDRAQKSLTAPSSLGQSVLKAALDELDEARADTRRLDALERGALQITHHRVIYIPHGMTLREYVDATMERKP